MASHTTPAAVNPGKFAASKGLKTIYSVFIVLGFLTFAAGLMQDPTRIWFSFLTSFFYFFSLAIGGLFFAAVQHVSHAGWSVTVRRFIEAQASYLPIAAVSAIVLLFGLRQLYIWMDPAVVAADHVLRIKSAYLNFGFFAVRAVVFFGGWLIFNRLILGHSTKQDKDGDENHTLRNSAVSIGFLVFFALSYSLFSVDAVMSLQPHWYSTIFGVYCFAGAFQSSIAFTVLITVYIMNKGLVRGLVNENHLHDLGKFMLAFTVFWAYIAFSQFMLIWYANLPEETIFFLNRASGGWMTISLALIVFKFAVPFLLMLPKWAKRTPAHMVFVAILILFMQYIDVYWMVYPNMDTNQVLFSWPEIGVFMGFLGLFLMSVSRFLERNNLVPIRDPHIQESIAHVVTY
jgi:hypothetical protein